VEVMDLFLVFANVFCLYENNEGNGDDVSDMNGVNGGDDDPCYDSDS
jgi:hypothetical protein